MAVLADGWHKSWHALALGPSVFAYRRARCHAGSARFALGTRKVEILAGDTTAILLLGVVALMAFQSLQRLLLPQTIHYQQAIAIAVVGLGVNLLCAWWLRQSRSRPLPCPRAGARRRARTPPRRAPRRDADHAVRDRMELCNAIDDC